MFKLILSSVLLLLIVACGSSGGSNSGNTTSGNITGGIDGGGGEGGGGGEDGDEGGGIDEGGGVAPTDPSLLAITRLYNSNLRGTGTVENPFIISNIYQLQAISGFDHKGIPLNESVYTSKRWLYGFDAADQLSKAYRLGGYIDASVTKSWTSNRTADVTGTRAINGWVPIGDCSAFAECHNYLGRTGEFNGAFKGKLDGADNRIDSLYISVDKSADGIGLFSAIDGGSISNLHLSDLNITIKVTKSGAMPSVNNMGAIAGIVRNTQLSEVASDGEIVAIQNVGGLVGHVRATQIHSSSTDVAVTGKAFVGGLVGRSDDMQIYRSFTEGSVAGEAFVGGLVGRAHFSQIDLSYSDSEVSGLGVSHSNIGGLAGYIYVFSIIRGSFASGSIVIKEGATVDYVGGLVGQALTRSRIEASYSGTSFELPQDFARDQENVGLMFGHLEIESSVTGSYSHSQNPSINNFAWGRGTVRSSYYIHTENRSSTSLAATNITIDQMRSCGLGEALPGATAGLDCSGIFSNEWGPRVIDNAQLSWRFAPNNFYPRLKVSDLESGVDVFPSPDEQHCLTATCNPSPKRLRFSQDSYSFVVSNRSAGDVLGTVVLSDTHSSSVPSAIYSISLITGGEFLDINLTSGEITLNQDVADPDLIDGLTIDVLVEDTTNLDYGVASVGFSYAGDIPSTKTDADSDGIVDRYDSAPQTPGMLGDGTPASPYIIFNIYQLQALAGVDHLGVPLSSSPFTNNRFVYGNDLTEQLAAHYQLGNNIDAFGYGARPFNFLPIGDCGTDNNCLANTADENPFRGSFHGKGYVISNLMIDHKRSKDEELLQPMGLFGQLTRESSITGVGLDNATIRGWYIAGALVGLMNAGVVSQSYVVGSKVEMRSVTGVASVFFSGGGMVGHMNSGLIKYSYSSGTSVTWHNVNSFIALFDSQFDLSLGGMVGNFLGGTLAAVYTIDNPLAVVGMHNPANVYRGGLVGTLERATIEGSYAVPLVETNTEITRAPGGLIGRLIGTQINFRDNYWIATGPTGSLGEKQVNVMNRPNLAQGQKLPQSFVFGCTSIDCLATERAGDFGPGSTIFPAAYWDGNIFADDLQSAAWTFNDDSYPLLLVTDGDGTRYLPGTLEQRCGFANRSLVVAGTTEEVCNLDADSLPKFSQDYYFFAIDLGNDSNFVGNVASSPHPSEVPLSLATQGYFILDSSAADGMSAEFAIDARGRITYDRNKFLAPGVYQLQVVAAFSDNSTAPIYERTELEILVVEFDTTRSMYTEVPPGTERGTGTVDDPYLISNVYQLQAIAGVDHLSTPLDESDLTLRQWLFGDSAADQLTKHYKLTKDIEAGMTIDWNFDGHAEIGFTPIGSCPVNLLSGCNNYSVGPFLGTFDGAGNSIIALYIDGFDRDANGLFGGIRNAEVKNLQLTSASVRGATTDDYNSILAGYAIDSTIINSSVDGSLDARYYTGGLVGYAKNSKIINSSATADPFYLGVALFGTLVGYLDGGSISQSSSSGSIVGYDASIGGLVGYSLNGRIIGSNSNAKIELRYNSNPDYYPYLPDGNDINDVGGLVGTQSGGEIIASYGLGSIEMIGAQDFSDGSNRINYGNRNNIGGLVGRMIDGKLLASYSLGDFYYGNPFSGEPLRSIINTTADISNFGGLIGLMEAGEVRAVYTSGNYSNDRFVSNPDLSFGTLVGRMKGGSFIGGYTLGSLGSVSFESLRPIDNTTSPSILPALVTPLAEQYLIGDNFENAGNFSGNRFDAPPMALANCVLGLDSLTLAGSSSVQNCSFNSTGFINGTINEPSRTIGHSDIGDSLTFYDKTYWDNATFEYKDGERDVTINYGWLFGGARQLPVLFAREQLLEDYLLNATLQRDVLSIPRY